MKMEVQIVSKESIKPSSPTPKYHRIYKLSFLDHLIPSPCAPIVLFYPFNDSTNLLSLKQSLSETLTRFYPLAGTIKDDLSIDCNDQGANLVETQVSCHLDDFLNKPDLLLIHKFLPCELILKESTENSVSNFQVNVFQCGGIAIGVCISHKVLDGAALSMFLRSWSAAARGLGDSTITPTLTASSLFPTKDLWVQDSSMVMWGSLFKFGKCKTRRFLFDDLAITNLKAKVMTKQGQKSQSPTRVELVSGLLWMTMMSASARRHGSIRPSFLTHLVNLRHRIKGETSLENSIGNLLWITPTIQMTDHEKELYRFVSEVRAGNGKIDGVFTMKLASNESDLLILESLKEISEMGKGKVDCYGFSSWNKLGFYEADFGWGKPVWVSSFGMDGSVFINLIILNDTIKGDGIEAWVTLDEQEMNILEKNEELLQYASLDPSLIQMMSDSK